MRKNILWGVGVLGVVCAVAGIWLWAQEPQTFEVRNEKAFEEKPAESSAVPSSNEEVNKESQSETAESQDPALQKKPETAPVQEKAPQEKKKTDPPAQDSPKTMAKKDLVSWGFSVSERRTIDSIIIHSSYNSLGGDKYDVDAIVDIYKSYGVSAHYIIGRDGKVRQLVLEKNIAYHAGVAKLPDGRTDVNAVSIGIEMVNDDKGDECTDKQYTALRNLIADIKSRHTIQYVLGHSDIASGRKTDPWNFDWKKVKK